MKYGVLITARALGDFYKLDFARLAIFLKAHIDVPFINLCFLDYPLVLLT